MKNGLLFMVLCILSSVRAWCADGDTFKYQPSANVELTLAVISETERTVQITKGEKLGYSPLSDDVFSIPSNANGYTITAIAENAFSNSYWIKKLQIPGSIKTIGTNAFYYCGGLTDLVLLDGVESIGENAFSLCSSLKSVTIPPSVISFGYNAFSNCYMMKEVHIEDLKAWCEVSFSEVYPHFSNPLWTAQHLFVGEEELLGHVTIPEGVTKVSNGVFLNFKGMTSVTIPESVTEIDSYAFCGCTNMTSVKMPDGVKSIGYAAFGADSSITSFTFPEQLEYIGALAFESCKKLPSVYISNNVKEIGQSAFVSCFALKDIIIGCNVTSIGMNAFASCKNLKNIVSKIENPFAFGIEAFMGISSESTLTVPNGTREAYIAAGWTDGSDGNTAVFKNIVELGFTRHINIGSSSISTYCCDYDLDFTSVPTLKAYIASGFSPSTGELLLTRAYNIPAGEGILLVGENGDYDVPYGKTDMVYSNLLKGLTTATTVYPTDNEYTNFILADGINGIGFYTLLAAGVISSGKAYLQLPTSSIRTSLSRGIKFVFDDEVTGVSCFSAPVREHYFFDLQGRLIKNNSAVKGLYIANRKKMYVK